MTRLQHHLNERLADRLGSKGKANKITEFDQRIIPMLKSQSKAWIAQVKKCKLGVAGAFRGVNTDTGKTMFIKKVRKNRKPKDTDKGQHKLADAAFTKYWGWPVRSAGLFVSGDYAQTAMYGDAQYAIFPIGPTFKYVWSKTIKDFHTDFGIYKPDNKKLDKEIKTKYQDSDLCGALDSGNELSIQTDKYIAVNVDAIGSYINQKENKKTVHSKEFYLEKFMREYL